MAAYPLGIWMLLLLIVNELPPEAEIPVPVPVIVLELSVILDVARTLIPSPEGPAVNATEFRTSVPPAVMVAFAGVCGVIVTDGLPLIVTPLSRERSTFSVQVPLAVMVRARVWAAWR
jgi:hypothetical protein